MINRFLIFSLLIILGCNSKQSSKEDPKDSLQLALTSEVCEKLLSPKFAWKDVETKISNEEKRKRFEENIRWVMPEYIDSSYLAGVHVMDFNGDGIGDFVYSGRGPVAWYTIVSITGDTAMFSEESIIINIDIVDKKVQRFYTNSSLSPIHDGYSIVDIIYEKNTISFVNRFRCNEIGRVFRPNKYSVFDVENISDSAIVRSEPISLDTPYNYVIELPGNHLGKIAKGTKATVVGQKDSLGMNWYFAMIWPDYKIKEYAYIGGNSTNNSYPLVWINERDCKRILK